MRCVADLAGAGPVVGHTARGSSLHGAPRHHRSRTTALCIGASVCRWGTSSTTPGTSSRSVPVCAARLRPTRAGGGFPRPWHAGVPSIDPPFTSSQHCIITNALNRCTERPVAQVEAHRAAPLRLHLRGVDGHLHGAAARAGLARVMLGTRAPRPLVPSPRAHTHLVLPSCACLQHLGTRYMVVSLLCEYNSIFLHLVRGPLPARGVTGSPRLTAHT